MIQNLLHVRNSIMNICFNIAKNLTTNNPTIKNIKLTL